MKAPRLSLSQATGMVLDSEDVGDGDAAVVGRTRSIPDWDCNPQSCQEDCNVHKLSCLLPWSAHLHRKLQRESILRNKTH